MPPATSQPQALMTSVNFNPKELASQEILQAGWIRHLDWQSHVDSTNSVARRWVSQSVPDSLPALFVADSQSAGRGRQQNVWWSPPGCLMLTLVLDGRSLQTNAETWGQLALVAGVAVAEAAAHFVDTDLVQLKWPNDLFVDQKKCGGILIESLSNLPQSDGGGPVWLMGIGINVDVDWTDAPSEVLQRATGLSEHTRVRLQLPSVLVQIISSLKDWIEHWGASDRHWQTYWQQRCLLTGKVVRIQGVGGTNSMGCCEGVDVNGQLILRNESGVQFFQSGEVIDWQ